MAFWIEEKNTFNTTEADYGIATYAILLGIILSLLQTLRGWCYVKKKNEKKKKPTKPLARGTVVSKRRLLWESQTITNTVQWQTYKEPTIYKLHCIAQLNGMYIVTPTLQQWTNDHMIERRAKQHLVGLLVWWVIFNAYQKPQISIFLSNYIYLYYFLYLIHNYFTVNVTITSLSAYQFNCIILFFINNINMQKYI